MIDKYIRAELVSLKVSGKIQNLDLFVFIFFYIA